MTPLYTTDVRTLPDADLATLMKEIEDAGWAYLDEGDYEPGCDEVQAQARFFEMEREVARRWGTRNPEEAAKRKAHEEMFAGVFAAQIEASRKWLMGRCMFASPPIASLFERGTGN